MQAKKASHMALSLIWRLHRRNSSLSWSGKIPDKQADQGQQQYDNYPNEFGAALFSTVDYVNDSPDIRYKNN